MSCFDYLFGHATIEEARAFKAILQQYESWSGQLVTVQKSAIQFSPNVDGEIRAAISDILRYARNCFSRYLRPPHHPRHF
ncbi:hypothetical protein LIER_13214 [Lithospermum erythrorhizon]|uniref:Uncharacterized protein n=1 Tax=Lithospermum erythrorhizon TaxID=34254 RepID=A0AAV3PV22_LITER